MKTLAAAILVLAAAAPALAQGSPLPVVPGQTAALYLFDEGSGTAVADASPNGRVGTLSGGVQWLPASGGGYALNFRDADALMTVLPGIPVGTTWTVQAWTLFPQSDLDGTFNVRSLVHYEAWNHHVAMSRNGNFGVTIPQYTYYTGNPMPSDGWHLLSVVGSGNQTVFYIDRASVGSVGVQQTNPIQYIGNYKGGHENWGAIDSLRILTSARTPTEVQADYDEAIRPVMKSLVQRASDGSVVNPGGTARTEFAITATLIQGFDTVPIRLQAEVRPLGAAFDGTTLLESVEVASDATASIRVQGLAPGSYRWRARAVDGADRLTAWVDCGSGSVGETDIVLPPNAAPSTSSVAQAFGSQGGTMPIGAPVFDDGGVTFTAPASDPEGDAVRLQVELRPVGVPFSGVATGEGPRVPAGAVATCLHPVGTGPQHWQARAVDEYGATSAWIAFGGNPEGDADFTVTFNGSTGPASCIASSTGGALSLLALASLLAIRR